MNKEKRYSKILEELTSTLYPQSWYIVFVFYFFNWDSLHARQNSHYDAWSYKKKKHENIKAYRKSV